ncbi:MAG: alpha-D-ribose 1-methylphosphonate 5-triphosphate diphosphatase, partial [Chloroflexota bacterium]
PARKRSCGREQLNAMWISNCRIVCPDRIIERGGLEVAEGVIQAVVEGPPPRADLDGEGLTCIPGLIDLHGDMVEAKQFPRMTARVPLELAVYELDKELVAAGITTAYAALALQWTEVDTNRTLEACRATMEIIKKKNQDLMCDHHIHARFEITNPKAGSVLEELIDAQLVDLVSLMDHTPGQGQVRDVERFIQWQMRFRAEMGRPSDEETIRADVSRLMKTPKAWDAVSSVTSVAHANRLIIASHDDDTPEKVASMRRFGVTISEFPVTLEAAEAAQQAGNFVLMGSPNALRGESTGGNLSVRDAVAAGFVDMLGCDYYSMGLLQGAYSLCHCGLISLPEAINMVSLNPAKAAGFDDRGSIEVGKKADFVLLSTSDSFPRVRGTWISGLPVFQDRVIYERTR